MNAAKLPAKSNRKIFLTIEKHSTRSSIKQTSCFSFQIKDKHSLQGLFFNGIVILSTAVDEKTAVNYLTYYFSRASKGVKC